MEVSVINRDESMVNEGIREVEVRCIDENGQLIGIIPTKEALKIAYDKDLDLVMVAQAAKPPVCRIMDYDKFIFDQNKKDKEIRKNQKVIDIKEVRLSIGIGDHDFMVKAKNAAKFLQSGDKVKVTVRFTTRELNHTNEGVELVKRMAECVKDYGTLDKEPKLEGKRMNVIINPK